MKRLAYIFAASLFVPLRLDVLSLSLYPSRLILILTVIPLIVWWFRAKQLRGRLADLIIIAHVLWASIAIYVVHGISHAQAIGIYAIEMIGCYFLGRATVRDADVFRNVCRVILVCVALTIPFAAYESFTNDNTIIDALGSFTIEKIEQEIRLGLHRAQVVFGHPILYGIVSASTFCLAYYVVSFGKSTFSRITNSSIPVVAGFFSLSSASFVLLAFQFGFIAWDHATRAIPKRWTILALMAVSAYIAISLLSNRTPIEVFVSYFSMNPANAYARILQFDYAIDDILRNWVFGLGFNDFTRPYWLVASVDNFWLVTCIRYGIPGFISLFLAFVLIVREAMSYKLRDPKLIVYRRSYCILLITIGLVIITVHLWSEAFYLFVFFLGCRTWITQDRHEDPPLEGRKPGRLELSTVPRPRARKAA